MATGFFSPGIKQPGREVNYSHLFPRLRRSGAVTLLHLYDFMAWTGKVLPLS